MTKTLQDRIQENDDYRRALKIAPAENRKAVQDIVDAQVSLFQVLSEALQSIIDDPDKLQSFRAALEAEAKRGTHGA